MSSRPRVNIGTIGHQGVGKMAVASMLAAGMDAMRVAQIEHDRIGQPTVEFGEVAESLMEKSTDGAKSFQQIKRNVVEELKVVELAGFQAGLAAAAKFLEGTAADYNQTSERLLRNSRNPTMHERKEQVACEEKSKLLTGQAGHVRSLKRI